MRVIAINRKTGYIASTATRLRAAAGGRVDVPVEQLHLAPPNLRVEAERWYDVEHGLTSGEERNYLIGFEGSALTSDTLVAVTTEWVDHDGSPLPPDLPGYTGRLARTVVMTPGFLHTSSD